MTVQKKLTCNPLKATPLNKNVVFAVIHILWCGVLSGVNFERPIGGDSVVLRDDSPAEEV